VARRQTSPEVIIIHRRQIIVHKRIRVHHLDRRRRYLHVMIYFAADKFAAPQRQHRTNPLAGCGKRVPQGIFELFVYLLDT
jgi:hypothetical protein